MKRLGAWPIFGALLALAFVMGVAADGEAQVSSVPSVVNPGPRGLRVLSTWLKEAGADVRRGEVPLTEVPDDVATVVIPAPIASTVTGAEIEALRHLLTRGRTVVLLANRRGSLSQYAFLAKLRGGPTPPILAIPKDGAGATAEVRFPVGLLAGARTLRVASEPQALVETHGAVALTEPPVLWAVPAGAGELYVALGADLIENARLDLADNAVIWRNAAARGPLWIDESHHQARATGRPTVNLVASGLQVLVVAFVFVLARGRRLGPPRAEPPPPLRSTAEYVDALAHMTLRARVDPELVEALRRQVRLTLQERLGLALSLPDAERARALSVTLGLEDEEARALFTDDDFSSLSRRVARLEERLDGHREA